MNKREIYLLLQAFKTRNLDLIDSLQDRFNCITRFEYVSGQTAYLNNIYEKRKFAKNEVVSEVIREIEKKFPDALNEDCTFWWQYNTEHVYFTIENDIALNFTVRDRKKRSL